MKFLSTHFDDYIENSNHNNLHDNIKYQTKDIENLNNLILYGPPGCGKYTQCLRIINNFSLSNLKYEKKLLHVFNKQNFNFKLSDIHIEIDMSLLGCNSKILWNELYNKILDIAFTKQDGYFIIVCLNFHMIHSELLENFYSYMQTFHLNMIKLKFILITEEISFISNNILNKCEIISVPRPTKTKYNKCIKNMNLYKGNISNITNIKDIVTLNCSLKPNENICNHIINTILNIDNFNYTTFRDNIYDLLILNMDIHESIWHIVSNILKKKHIKQDKYIDIIKKMYVFFQYYNNNYRPIYHLESFLLYLISEIHEL